MRCRTQGGRLHLVENVGKIALADVTLVEDPNEEDGRAAEDDEGEPSEVARARAKGVEMRLGCPHLIQNSGLKIAWIHLTKPDSKFVVLIYESIIEF